MITESEIYWITRLDYFQNAALIAGAILSCLSLIGLIISFGAWIFDEDEEGKCAFKIILPIFMLFFCLVIGSCFIPSTKEMCAIKVIPMVVNDEKVQEIPDKVMDLADAWIEELKPRKKQGEK